jgi:hypothetical protein
MLKLRVRSLYMFRWLALRSELLATVGNDADGTGVAHG